MVDKNHKIVLSHSEVHLREDGIVNILFIKGSEIDLEACKELLATYDQLLENRKYPLLHRLGDSVSVTKETREFSVTERGLQYSKAEAYIFTSLAHRLIANFYIKMNKPPVPTKFFKNEEEAVFWLKKFL